MHTLDSLRAGKLCGIKRLDLSCGLKEFPEEIYELSDTLEILNLSGNHLSALPDDLTRLQRLRIIFCSENDFTELPEVLGQCLNLEVIGFKANKISLLHESALSEKLRWLILTDNKLTSLPANLGTCVHLQKLMLSGNHLQLLPEEMIGCTSLELLRIAANRLDFFPEWLLALPRLAWLAYAGNPFSDGLEIAAMDNQQHKQIDWQTLRLQQALGEGASGVIYQALLQSPNKADVAVKVFKGDVTSDGLPRSEKSACLIAGSHPGLIPILGELTGHPAGKPGLVMSQIDKGYINLAGPPSLESCTRDIYPAGTRYTLPVAINIALGIAAATEHLHARGLIHGDLYAHNIMVNEQGDCLLGDMGAASFLPKNNLQQSVALQRIEVRAFACLLEELINRCVAPAKQQSIVEKLRDLKISCEQCDVKARPLFTEIRLAIQSIYDSYQLSLENKI